MPRTFSALRAPLGRYSPGHNLSHRDLPRVGRRLGGKIEIAHGHEADPEALFGLATRDPAAVGAALRRRRPVAINVRTDLLEYEHQRNRVSAPAYAAGRYIDGLLEAANGRRSTRDFGDSCRPPLSSHTIQQALVARIDAARAAHALKESMARDIGASACRVVTLVIGDGLSFRDVARMDARLAGKAKEGPPSAGKGRDCERAAQRIAGLFRDALEQLAAIWAQRGQPV